ncbi:gp499 [Bacillus phage G]|uniref:Gp499 n=1 Tax=Bacillus phage G TaxID=2884420 RepID=G3MAP0_9CAUD|nr:gp499 [Bacillus phage G]AEO93757.1 gp499 [Bacillus phage G]
MVSMLNIYKISKQMEKIHKKVTLLNRKQSSFGLTAEEEEKLRDYRLESWILHEELIETHLGITVIPYVLDDECTAALRDIQKVIPWRGGLIRRDGEYEEITTKAIDISVDERDYIAKKLEILHENVLLNFESFSSTEEGYEYMREVSKVVSTEKDGNVLDVLVYLDARYREFAELLDIQLQEVEVVWEDEE